MKQTRQQSRVTAKDSPYLLPVVCGLMPCLAIGALGGMIPALSALALTAVIAGATTPHPVQDRTST